jgi:signal transduction histidine kinase
VHRRFLTQLGHEFGHPLRRIIDAAGDPARAAELRRAGLELEARLQDVLGLVPPDEHATSLPVDLAACAQGVLALVRARALDAGTGLVSTTPTGPAQIDAALLTPVLVNLLANAIAAAPGGRVELGAVADAHGVRWKVSDDGRGLDPTRASAIVGALREGRIAAGDERIGLGLALCLANLRAMGGRLELSSPGPGQGTVASAWVPWPGRGLGD